MGKVICTILVIVFLTLVLGTLALAIAGKDLWAAGWLIGWTFVFYSTASASNKVANSLLSEETEASQ